MSRLPKNVGVFCKRALQKRPIFWINATNEWWCNWKLRHHWFRHNSMIYAMNEWWRNWWWLFCRIQVSFVGLFCKRDLCFREPTNRSQTAWYTPSPHVFIYNVFIYNVFIYNVFIYDINYSYTTYSYTTSIIHIQRIHIRHHLFIYIVFIYNVFIYDITNLYTTYSFTTYSYTTSLIHIQRIHIRLGVCGEVVMAYMMKLCNFSICVIIDVVYEYVVYEVVMAQLHHLRHRWVMA